MAENGDVLRIRKENVTWREVAGEIIALDLESSKYFTTNTTGAMLWHALIDGSTLGELVTLMQKRFGIDEQQATIDVTTFLGLIETHGLLQRS